LTSSNSPKYVVAVEHGAQTPYRLHRHSATVQRSYRTTVQSICQYSGRNRPTQGTTFRVN